MDEPKPSKSDLREDRIKENIQSEIIYVDTDESEKVATVNPRKCRKVRFCVHQNLTQLLDATFPVRKRL
jgi:hypothetical protein